jgi:hypothetical protein
MRIDEQQTQQYTYPSENATFGACYLSLKTSKGSCSVGRQPRYARMASASTTTWHPHIYSPDPQMERGKFNISYTESVGIYGVHVSDPELGTVHVVRHRAQRAGQGNAAGTTESDGGTSSNPVLGKYRSGWPTTGCSYNKNHVHTY